MLFKLLPLLFCLFLTGLRAQISPVSIEKGIELAKKESKLIFLLKQRSDCPFAKHFESTSLQDPEVQKILSRNFIFAREVIQERSLKIPESLATPYLQRRKDVWSIPEIQILEQDSKLLQTFSGKISEKKLRLILIFFGEGHYKKTPWEKFLKAFHEG